MKLGTIIAFLLLGLCLFGCSTSKEETAPLTKAYRLLDKSENAEAIVLLEEFLKTHPDNEEAQILLSSAYLGAAGLDVFATYNTFRDLLFEKSLGEVFFKKPKLPQEANPEYPKTEAVLEKFIYSLDFFLTQLRNVVHFLDRFPHVKSHHWPLLDEALVHLAEVKQSREISLYRLFLRVVYLKSYLDVEWVRNQEVGSAQWFCELKAIDLKEKFLWILDHSNAGLTDLNRVYPNRGTDWEDARVVLSEAQSWIENDTPSGTYSSLMLLESNLRGRLKCDEITAAHATPKQ